MDRIKMKDLIKKILKEELLTESAFTQEIAVDLNNRKSYQ